MHQVFTREKQKYQNIKRKQSMHVKSRSNKVNEWPLMSTSIKKSMPRKSAENESKVV